MEIHRPDYWIRDPALDQGATTSMAAILPRVGQRAAVGFAPDTASCAGAVETLLWQPPYTELNGWVDQPSEIAESYLVVAKVVDVSPSLEQRSGFANVYRHHVDIVSCEPLLPMLHGLHEDAKSWSLVKVGTQRGTVLVWDEVHWCSAAAIDGLIFVTGNADQSFMELIVDDVDGELFGLFNGHMDPGGSGHHVGRHRLDRREQKTIRQVIQKAHRLADTCPAYLTA
ncbi:hypothetical protein [Massilia rubra]|uniref:Uncharacterized protein n=1 Tax=Massilia rubra TaxID=2607910 RepID=A0ABX0LGY6_9BURK|nr:hypothetical protein [Massilia rubra]NHZ33959.1 hypothetical protein [Massilia rubra]